MDENGQNAANIEQNLKVMLAKFSQNLLVFTKFNKNYGITQNFTILSNAK
jgi:hypothetical protein